MINAIKNYLKEKKLLPVQENAAGAYDVWSAGYDSQPGNLMLDTDAQLFNGFMERTVLRNRRVADIGCGTGRHWQKIYLQRPALLLGFDVSEGMLRQLKQKYPHALAEKTTDNKLNKVPDAFVHCLISTLTVAHIKNTGEAIAAWARIMANGADLWLTDFHPAILAMGGKRSFRHNGSSIEVVNYVHPLPKLKKILAANGFTLVSEEERCVDESVKWYYESQNALHVYERFRGMPFIYALHLKKAHAPE